MFFIVQEVILNFSDDIIPEPNKSLHDSGGWSLVEKILWYGRTLKSQPWVHTSLSGVIKIAKIEVFPLHIAL